MLNIPEKIADHHEISVNHSDALETLCTEIRRRRKEFEAQRFISPDIIQQFKKIGVYRAFVAKRFGGDEISPAAFCRLVERIAQADGSAGWVASFGIGGIYLSALPLATLEKLYANDTQRYIDNIDSQTAADTICVFRSQDENLHNLQAAGVQTRISEFDAHRIVKQAVADKDVLLRKTQHGTGFQTGTGHLSLDETPAETVEPDRSALTRKDVRELDARVIAGKLRSYSRQLESEYPGQLPQVFTVSNNTRVLFSLTKTDKDAFGAEFVTDAGDFSESAWQMYLKMYREIKDVVDKTKTFSLAIESGFERHVLLVAFKHSRGIPYYNMPTKNVLALRMSLYNQVLKTMIDTFGPFVEHLGFVPANQRF